MTTAKTLNFNRWKGHIKSTLSCVVCGQEFTTFPSAIKRGTKCCSIVCRNINRKGSNAQDKHYNWQGGKIIKTCIVCKNQFHVKREQESRTGAKFCSLNCRSIYNVRHHHGSQDTDIERIIENVLIILGVPYRKQVTIQGIACVDFIVGENNIIQCDGDYWHSLPSTIERDHKQDGYLIKHGYRVLRLKGSEIKKQKELCVGKIKTFLNVGLEGKK